MKEWFHEPNLKEGVLAPHPLVAQIIELNLSAFPRVAGCGWKLPKLHGLTKFVMFMKSFGSASIFFGGVGESNHKSFVKDTDNNTQQRACNFNSQIALRYYKRMVCDIAHQALVQRNKSQYNTHPIICMSYPVMEGKYKLTLNINGSDFTDPIISDGKRIHVKFVKAMDSFVFEHDSQSRQYNINGYTACKLQLDGRDEIFHATSSYGTNDDWYDRCLIQWHGFDESYATRILGFLSSPTLQLIQIIKEPL
jgi:hypothetical protein